MENLTREEVIRVIEGKGAASRLPLYHDMWIHDILFDDDPAKREAWLSRYPQDINDIYINSPGRTRGPGEDPDFFWACPGTVDKQTGGLDARALIPDWEDEAAVEEFYRTFPNPDSPAVFLEHKPRDGRYVLGRWWYTFFERHWELRGMENALTDYYLYPEQVHRLFAALAKYYMRVMERAKEELQVDGFFISDDIGTQTAPFFSLEIFREFFKPYYKMLIDKAHSLGAHVWLHACGNVQLFLPDFIEIGLDVIHPIQKNTMDEQEIARQFGGQICILSGVDVQYLFAFGTPEEVDQEMEYLIKTFARPDGRMMLTMGNGSTVDWKIENLDAMYRASLDYGTRYAAGFTEE